MGRLATVSALALSWLASGSALAQVANGDILVPEYSLGSVVNIRGGGDFTDAPRFATGLTTPMGLCQGPNGDVFVTEHDTGEVTIITDGGNFAGAAAFATGLSAPASLLCSPTQVLVTELNSAQVTDITAGGSFTGVEPYARIDRNPADLLRDSSDRLWLTSFNDGVIEITGGGDFRGDPYYAPNDLADDSSIAITEMAGALLVGNEHTDQIVNFTAGGNLSGRPVFAQVRGVIGLRYVPARDWLLAASELDDAIYQIAAGGDFTDGDQPFATGLDPFDVAHLLYVGAGSNPEPDPDAGPGADPDAGADPGGDAGPDPGSPDASPGSPGGPNGGGGGDGGCSAADTGSAPLGLLLLGLVSLLAGLQRRLAWVSCGRSAADAARCPRPRLRPPPLPPRRPRCRPGRAARR